MSRSSPPSAPDPDVLRRLDALEAESSDRRAELRRLATALPHAVSRRAVLRSMAGDLRRAPDKPAIVRRLVAKLLRAPAGVVRRVRRRFGGAG